MGTSLVSRLAGVGCRADATPYTAIAGPTMACRRAALQLLAVVVVSVAAESLWWDRGWR